MEKHFVTYEQALALKELGFDEPCWSYFITPFDDGEGIFNPSMFLKDYAYLDTMPKHSTYILAPLRSQVFEWARKEHVLYHIVHQFEHKKNTTEEFLSEVSGKLLIGNDDISGFSYHSTYEEAESACIDNLIEIVKSKK